ncbi:hypothetical protein L1987_62202 [Smallanthus sonchifolius]|uniref:Uncharacterized protein n=1 Tax=Smallanthus sonchifolius TaxID=185202 RepID=A0ACB9C9U0_9ASTR|nr:hypothetical protein L1987_62202 [Smallanthus sonchifolius]
MNQLFPPPFGIFTGFGFFTNDLRNGKQHKQGHILVTFYRQKHGSLHHWGSVLLACLLPPLDDGWLCDLVGLHREHKFYISSILSSAPKYFELFKQRSQTKFF